MSSEVLLERGANPDQGRPLTAPPAIATTDAWSCSSPTVPGVAGTWAVGAAVHADDAQGGDAPARRPPERNGGRAAREATKALVDAAAHGLCRGRRRPPGRRSRPDADDDAGRVRAAPGGAGRPGPGRRAARGRGARDDSTDIDRFIGACLHADRHCAERLLAEHPDLRDRLTDEDRAAVVEAAGSASVAAVGLMLDLGFSPMPATASASSRCTPPPTSGTPKWSVC